MQEKNILLFIFSIPLFLLFTSSASAENHVICNEKSVKDESLYYLTKIKDKKCWKKIAKGSTFSAPKGMLKVAYIFPDGKYDPIMTVKQFYKRKKSDKARTEFEITRKAEISIYCADHNKLDKEFVNGKFDSSKITLKAYQSQHYKNVNFSGEITKFHLKFKNKTIAKCIKTTAKRFQGAFFINKIEYTHVSIGTRISVFLSKFSFTKIANALLKDNSKKQDVNKSDTDYKKIKVRIAKGGFKNGINQGTFSINIDEREQEILIHDISSENIVKSKSFTVNQQKNGNQ